MTKPPGYWHHSDTLPRPRLQPVNSRGAGWGLDPLLAALLALLILATANQHAHRALTTEDKTPRTCQNHGHRLVLMGKQAQRG